MTQRISKKAAAIEPSATLSLDARAKALKAAGEDVIVFGAGEPDFPTPEPIAHAAASACLDPSNHHYTPASGLPELRGAIAKRTSKSSGVSLDASNVIVTNGGKHAIFDAMMTLLDPGDEVLIVAPYWTTYPEVVRIAGGKPVFVETTESSSFCPEIADLEAAVTERTKLLVHVSPSNPTGTVFPPELVAEIGRFALERDIFVLADEIYESLVYPPHRHVSILSAVPELADRCVITSGVAKAFAMTGWRVGWLVGPKDVIEAAGNLQSHMTSNVANVSQRAALAALEGSSGSVEEMARAFARRRALVLDELSKVPGVTVSEPGGAFYVFPSVEGLLGTSWRGSKISSSAELAEALLDSYKVAMVPGEAFGAPGFLRISYALGDEGITEGIRRFARFAAELLEGSRAGCRRNR